MAAEAAFLFLLYPETWNLEPIPYPLFPGDSPVPVFVYSKIILF